MSSTDLELDTDFVTTHGLKDGQRVVVTIHKRAADGRYIAHFEEAGSASNAAPQQDARERREKFEAAKAFAMKRYENTLRELSK